MLLLNRFLPRFWKAASAAVEIPSNLFDQRRHNSSHKQFPAQTGENHALTEVHASCAVIQKSPDQIEDKTARLVCYESLPALAWQLRATEHDCNLPLPTVVLVLAPSFAGDLPSLIQRTVWAPRLVIVAENGRIPLPRGMMPGDLAAQEGALGWGQIVFERDVEIAVDDSWESLESGESLIVFWPAWQTQSIPLQRLRGKDSRLSASESF